jgi:hypothetical protein
MRLKNVLSLIILLVLVCLSQELMAQCSICTKTAQQLGPHAARNLNSGILYLMATPFAIVSVVTYRWWKSGNRKSL